MSTREQTSSGRTLLVGVDFSEYGDAALLEAAALLKANPGTVLHGVHVIPMRAAMATDDTLLTTPPDLDHVVDDLSRHMQAQLATVADERADAVVFAHVRIGDAAREIAQLAVSIDADTILVGTHGRRGIARLVLGSVAERVLRHATCPVLVVCPKRHGASNARPPNIQPPCERCAETRAASSGKELWCEMHRGAFGITAVIPSSRRDVPSP